jgi:archaemetzincin
MRLWARAALGVVAFLGVGGWAESRCMVALQPLGQVSPEDVQSARAALAEFWGAEVEVLPAQPLPTAAWYPPRQRYRADRLIDFLTTLGVPQADRVVGLTGSDISITKDPYPDWGIFGVGELGGRACVVSTYRLRRGAREDLPRARLVKVLNHELGHTFGLEHCTTKHCLMDDANGSISTVDAEPGELCDACRKRVQAQGLKAGERALPCR